MRVRVGQRVARRFFAAWRGRARRARLAPTLRWPDAADGVVDQPKGGVVTLRMPPG
jgi:hypothetical protein